MFRGNGQNVEVDQDIKDILGTNPAGPLHEIPREKGEDGSHLIQGLFEEVGCCDRLVEETTWQTLGKWDITRRHAAVEPYDG